MIPSMMILLASHLASLEKYRTWEGSRESSSEHSNSAKVKFDSRGSQ